MSGEISLPMNRNNKKWEVLDSHDQTIPCHKSVLSLERLKEHSHVQEGLLAAHCMAYLHTDLFTKLMVVHCCLSCATPNIPISFNPK